MKPAIFSDVSVWQRLAEMPHVVFTSLLSLN
jgi:hypothetical protein